MRLLIKNGRVVHPVTGTVMLQDILAEDGRVSLMERGLDCGALTSREFETLSDDPFLRAHAAYLSYYSLDVPLSGSRQTLAQRLTAAGVFTEAQLTAAKGQVNSPRLG